MKTTLLSIVLLTFLCSLSFAEDKIMTKWGRELKPDSVWAEYPRPQFQREQWTNLNGYWDYAIQPHEAAAPQKWDGKILVPFCPESALSGVKRFVQPTDDLWYQRTLNLKPTVGKRMLLTFEAVDYSCIVSLNGKELGKHVGGHTPFSFDITSAMKDGENMLSVRVHDETEGFQLHGKQTLKPQGIWYTPVTGIWQTVWLEEVPESYLTDLDYNCDYAAGTITITPKHIGGASVRIAASINGKAAGAGQGNGDITIKLIDPQLWSPTAPNLYDLKVELLDDKGAVLDTVKAYTALRNFGKQKNANGDWTLMLNGKPIFHWGPLDQGWWPDGLLTPPSDAAMASDIQFLKDAGFNMIRKHIKVEPRRYYYHCDHIGMMMWQDQVSCGKGINRSTNGSSPKWTRLAPNPTDAKWPEAEHEQWITEYKRMVDHLRDAPCIAMWVPFNEAWGQHNTMEIGAMAVAYDHTRLVNVASGGNFWPVGDIVDQHRYPHPDFGENPARFKDFVKVMGEFGGHGWPVPGHLWDTDQKNWGYGGLPKTLDEWKVRYQTSIDKLVELQAKGIAAGVYTQTTDVEGEVNGLLTYDRTLKIDVAWLKAQSDKLFAK